LDKKIEKAAAEENGAQNSGSTRTQIAHTWGYCGIREFRKPKITGGVSAAIRANRRSDVGDIIKHV
jgi:hypothetical protein